MTQPAYHLHLTTEQSPPWDAKRWLWTLRDSGSLARLGPAEVKVLFALYAHADAHGEAWPSLHLLARETGYGSRAVREARRSLHVTHGLLDLVHRGGRAAGDTNRFRLVMPITAPVVLGGNAGSAQGGTPVPSRGERGTPQSIRKKENKRSSGSARPPSLFEPGEYDAAAAAILSRVGFSPKQAHGLISQYRPTVQHLRNIVVNIAAKNHAATAGQGEPVRSRPAFFLAAIRACNYALDERVHELKRIGRQRAQAATRRRTVQTAAVVDTVSKAREEADLNHQLDAMSAAERDALKVRALSQFPEGLIRSEHRIRMVMLAQLKKESQS